MNVTMFIEFIRFRLMLEPDITKHTLQDNDEYMILASDGLFQDLSSQEVVDALSACISGAFAHTIVFSFLSVSGSHDVCCTW